MYAYNPCFTSGNKYIIIIIIIIIIKMCKIFLAE